MSVSNITARAGSVEHASAKLFEIKTIKRS